MIVTIKKKVQKKINEKEKEKKRKSIGGSNARGIKEMQSKMTC